MALLGVSHLKVDFPGRRGNVVAIDDVSLTLQRGEILGLVGESGAGKSTIGNAVIGLLQRPGRIIAGEVNLEGMRLDRCSDAELRQIRGKRIGVIFQDPFTSLDPLQTIESQLVETMRSHLALTTREAHGRAVELLESVGIDQAPLRLKQYPHQFSGGMRQRVVIALALCCDPDVVIADEPTTALDVSIQEQILVLLRALCREKQVGMILITHDMGVIAEVADRVVVLYRGRSVEEGPTEQILGQPQHPYTQSLVSAVPRPDIKLRRFPLVTYIEDVHTPQHEDLDLAAAWLREDLDLSTASPGQDAVQIRDLSVRFILRSAWLARNRVMLDAVKKVSFSIRSGEVFGLVGESGSGKSTIARVVAGLYQPSAGTILFDGADIATLQRGPQRNDFRRKVQMVFQDPFSSLDPRMRIRDIIAEPIRFHRLADDEPQTQRIVNGLLGYVGLEPDALRRFPHEFSGGQRQRICIARALATRPTFLICDEPTSALDVSIQAQILNLLKDLQERLHLTILFISHDLPVIRQMCDRVGVLQHGELLETAETESLFTHPQHPYSQRLLSLMPRLQFLPPVG